MNPSAPPLPPLYAHALRWRVYALSLWLGRLALAPFGLARAIEPLLVVPLVVGLIGAALGPIALWRHDRASALLEAVAVGLTLVPALGWASLSYGAAPTSPGALPLGTGPLWLPIAGLTWLLTMACIGHRSDAMRAIAWLPSMTLLALDLPPLHRYIFAFAPRLADALAPLSMVLAIFALARMEKRTRPTPAR